MQKYLIHKIIFIYNVVTISQGADLNLVACYFVDLFNMKVFVVRIDKCMRAYLKHRIVIVLVWSVKMCD